MPTPVSSLGVLPSGRLHLLSDGESDLAAAFQASTAAGLLYLATAMLEAPLPPDLAFARELGRAYLTSLCRGSGSAPPPAPGEFTERALAAPPLPGIEYLNAAALAAWWNELDALVQAQIRASTFEPQAFLERLNPVWRLVGRVSFHLAENKRDPSHPFAFLATYASRVSAQGKLQHQPLSRALQEYAGAGNRAALVTLLQPLQRAAEASSWVRALVESGDVYHPLAWTPPQAYALLQAVAALEAAGVVVRLPDWWNPARPPRPRVRVAVGSRAGVGGLGMAELLDFSVAMTVEGEPLSANEIAALLATEGGLVSLKGRWVEVDAAQLQAALGHWKKVERAARGGGLSFFEGMRLLAGVHLDEAAASAPAGEDGAAAVADWSHIVAGPALQATLEALRRPGAGDQPRPPGLQAELRPYQVAGVAWLRLLTGLGLGACLADDMGLGKTIQVIALLLERRRAAAGPSLLVVPASLIANWQAELARFAPQLKVLVAHPTVGDWDPAAEPDDADLVITTYTMLPRLETLRARRWPLLVLDEAQAIKNAGTRQAHAAKALSAAARIALTGTPIENRLGDLWSLFDFLNPGLLGDPRAFGRFEKRLAAGGGEAAYAPLRRLVQPYILRRMKTDKGIAGELPDKTEVEAYCGLSRRQAALYQRQVDELAAALEVLPSPDDADRSGGRPTGGPGAEPPFRAARGRSGIQRRGLVLAALLRFKQICNHPSQVAGDGLYTPAESGKFQRLGEICRELAERQEKVLVFTQFRELTEPLAAFLAGVFGRPGLTLDGSTPLPQRRQRVAAFQADDASAGAGPPFFVLSLKAGGTGLNLTAATHVIHFDRWWNPAVEAQATDRAFRLGQKRNVLVHKFVCRGTVEDKINAMLVSKKLLADRLIEGGGEPALTELDNQELLALVRLDLRAALATEGA